MTATSEPSPSPSALPVQSDGQWHAAGVWEVPPAGPIQVHGPGGLYHVRFRVYDPWSGRWLTRDPAGFIDGSNLYEYCMSDSITCLDPFGLDTCQPEDKKREEKKTHDIWDGSRKAHGAPWFIYDRSNDMVYEVRKYYWIGRLPGANPTDVEVVKKARPDLDRGWYFQWVRDNGVQQTADEAWNMYSAAVDDVFREAGNEFGDEVYGITATAGLALLLKLRNAVKAVVGGHGIEDAVYGQKSYREKFGKGDTNPFREMTIEEVVEGIKKGDYLPSMLPIEVIKREGKTYIMNTRSAIALERAGISRDRWHVKDVSGIKEIEADLTQRLEKGGGVAKPTSEGAP